MNVDKLKEKLADIDADTLRNFILDLYLRYPELNDKIEALTLANDPLALSRVLRKRIASLNEGGGLSIIGRVLILRANWKRSSPTLKSDCWSAHQNTRLIWLIGSWRRQNRCSTVSMILAGRWARYIAKPYCCG